MDIFLDFETRSRIDLIKAGSTRYAQDPSTEIICLAWAVGDSEPELWVEGQEPPKDLLRYVQNGAMLHGWNALSFERNIWRYQCAEKLGWLEPTLEQWYDTMHDALALALPAALDDCAKAVGKRVLQKDKEGKRLIQFLCKPIGSGKKKGQFRSRSNYPREYASLGAYCKQDVRAERSIYRWLPRHVSGIERDIQLMTARINERGAPIDIEAVKCIINVLDRHVDNLNEECKAKFGCTARQVAQLKEWINDRGHELPDLTKETVDDALKTIDDAMVIEALTYRQRVSKSSTAKYRKMLVQVCDDGCIHDNIIYHKAGTGRYAGAGVQLQNLPRRFVPDPDRWIELFKTQDLDLIKLYGDPMDMASALIRSMIKAPPGKKLMDSDLSKIEAIGTAYIAKEADILEAHRQGLDNYKVSAARMFKVEYSKVDGEQRQTGKIAELSGGFGGGAKAIIKGAKKAGLELAHAEAEQIKTEFRAARPNLVKTWYAFGNASVKALLNPNSTVPVRTNVEFQFRYEGDFLYMALPNGRRLSFPFPVLKWITWEKKFPVVTDSRVSDKSRQVATAMWVNSDTKKWERRGLSGPNLFQSAVQGMCRDILMEAHLRIEEDELPIILSVHDESVSLVPDSPSYLLSNYNRLMKQPPDWLHNMPINANGWIGYRYKKD